MNYTLLETLKKMPLFNTSDLKKFVPNYSKEILNDMLAKNMIYKIKNGTYSFYEDPYILANYLVSPAYITSVSALSHYGLIDQLPHDTISFTTTKKKELKFKRKFYYYNTKYFFGFKEENYNEFKVNFATPEKAVIDSFGIVPLEYFINAFNNLNIKLLKTYLIKINNISLNKRIGYILEKKNIKIKLPINDYNYILLNPSGSKKGTKNKKWHIIENYGDL